MECEEREELFAGIKRRKRNRVNNRLIGTIMDVSNDRKKEIDAFIRLSYRFCIFAWTIHRCIHCASCVFSNTTRLDTRFIKQPSMLIKIFFPTRARLSKPIVSLFHSVNQDSITLSLSLGSLNPLYGSLPRSRTVLHRLHYETSQYKENANLFATGCKYKPISTLFMEKLQEK